MKKALVLFFVGLFFVSTTSIVEAHGRRSSKTAVIGAVGLLGLIGLFGLARSLQAADVDKTAITEEHRTRREHIRASTVLGTPAALGGSGSAGYQSSEGYANINANL